jgi:hypothetical protein
VSESDVIKMPSYTDCLALKVTPSEGCSTAVCSTQLYEWIVSFICGIKVLERLDDFAATVRYNIYRLLLTPHYHDV